VEKAIGQMGGCCSKAPDSTGLGLTGREDIASLIRTENMTTEAMRKVIGPPAPLLKEISFATIVDDDDEQSTSGTGDEADTEKPAQP
jgi:hypothetical protein